MDHKVGVVLHIYYFLPSSHFSRLQKNQMKNAIGKVFFDLLLLQLHYGMRVVIKTEVFMLL